MRIEPPKGEPIFNFDTTFMPDFSPDALAELPQSPQAINEDGRTIGDSVQGIKSGKHGGSIDEGYYHLIHGE